MPSTKTDPSRTGTIRRAYEAEFLRRISTVRKFLYQAIVTQDVLGLRPMRQFQPSLPGNRRYAALPIDQRARAFGQWLLNLVDDAVLEGQDMVGRPGDGLWQRTFIRRAYLHGVTTTTTELQRMGRQVADQTASQIMQSRFHRTRLLSLYERNLDELKGFTSSMATDLKRVVADGMLRGTNPKAMASDIAKRIDISVMRARRIARSEVIRANAESTLSTFEQFNERTTQADVESQLLTAGDERVCPICESLDGKIYTIEEARGVIPVHPNC